MSRICLLLLLASAAAAQPGVRAQFIGGTLAGVSPKSNLRLDLSDAEVLAVEGSGARIRIPYQKINTLEYGQNVSRRYAAAVLISPILLLSKSRKHFLTLGYLDSAETQQALVFRIQKGDIRSILSGLEARTGRRVEYQDNEARKGGK